MSRRDLPLWVLRALWVALPLTAGSVVSDAIGRRSDAVTAVAAGLVWAGWALALLALVVPRPRALTALRLVAPWAPVVVTWAALDAGERGDLAWIVLAGAAAGLAFLPEVGSWHVNGPSYGDERRFPLRAPGALLLGPLPLAGAAVVPAVATGPLLVAADRWVVGAVVTAAGWFVALACARAVDALANRWFVLVPAGVVLKDHVTLAEPVLFRRADVASLSPAPANTEALDLTARSFGLALELVLRAPYDLHRVVPGQQRAELGASSVLLFTPTRPGAVLAAARSRRLPTA